ncbi:nmrA-like family protein [Sarocladium implicatum]|nr:nmrA-like family protein [Sarocladium implicatum]
MSRSILVTGATGKQGGALIQSLLGHNADFRILALTRNAASPSAQRLASKSTKVSLVQGNLDDTEAVFAEAKKISPSIWGVFAVITVNMGGEGAIVEEYQGKKLVDSAIKHGVKHFVYTSSGRGGDQPTDVPHFATKHNVEQHLISLARTNPITWTILRPVAFMDNFDGGFLGKIFSTGWRQNVKSRRLQLIATSDIGLVGAKVFLSPEEYKERVINLAGDELTFEEMARVYKETTGVTVPTTFGFMITLLFWLSKEMRLMFAFFERQGFGVDLDETRKVLPEVQDFKTWLAKNKK